MLNYRILYVIFILIVYYISTFIISFSLITSSIVNDNPVLLKKYIYQDTLKNNFYNDIYNFNLNYIQNDKGEISIEGIEGKFSGGLITEIINLTSSKISGTLAKDLSSPRTILYLKLGKIIELHGGGKSVRSFVNIRDVANATMEVAERGEPGEIYHIAPQDEDITISELVRLICRIMKSDYESSVKEIGENFGQDGIYSLDSRKIRTELGWESQVTLENGIQEMITWIEDNWDTVRNMPLEYTHKP